MGTFFDSSKSRERYDSDMRYLSESSESDDPVKLAVVREENGALDAAMKHLDFRDREIIMVCDLKEIPCADVAEARGKTESAIRSQLFRARRRLKQLMV